MVITQFILLTQFHTHPYLLALTQAHMTTLMDKLPLRTVATSWDTDNVILPCEGLHPTVAIYANGNNKIERISNYVIVVLHFNNRGMFEW